jgi:hypothetical protein
MVVGRGHPGTHHFRASLYAFKAFKFVSRIFTPRLKIVNIGSMVDAKIHNVAKSFSSYVGERKNCELLIGEATMNEVSEIIKNLVQVKPPVLLAYHTS